MESTTATELIEGLGEQIGEAVVERLDRRRRMDLVARRVLAKLQERGLSYEIVDADLEAEADA